MRSIYQPPRVVNQIDRIRGDNKPCQPLNSNAAKMAGSRGNTKQTEKAKAERERKYSIICKPIRDSIEPVTTHMAAAAIEVDRKWLADMIRAYDDCPFEFGRKIGNTNSKRLVLKAH